MNPARYTFTVSYQEGTWSVFGNHTLVMDGYATEQEALRFAHDEANRKQSRDKFYGNNVETFVN